MNELLYGMKNKCISKKDIRSVEGNTLDSSTQKSEQNRVKKDDDSLYLGRHLRAYKARGGNLAHLAREAKISKATLHAWTNNAKATDIAALRRLAAAMNMSLHKLLWGSEDPVSQVSLDSTRLQDLFSGRFIIDLTLKKIDEPKKE